VELTWQVSNNHTGSLIAAATCKPPRSAFRTWVKFQKAYLAQIWHSLTDKQRCAVFSRQKTRLQTLWHSGCSEIVPAISEISRKQVESQVSPQASLNLFRPSIIHPLLAQQHPNPHTRLGSQQRWSELCEISYSAPPSFRNGFYLPILDVPSTFPRKLTTIARSYSVTSAH
jgi:hypothetical protein